MNKESELNSAEKQKLLKLYFKRLRFANTWQLLHLFTDLHIQGCGHYEFQVVMDTIRQ
jgi:hypothetical protein